MKKVLWIMVGFLAAVVVLGGAGFAYAHSQTPQASEYPFGFGMMGGHGHGRIAGDHMMHWEGGHMMDWEGDHMMHRDGEYGPMHNTMIAVLAEALDLSPDELEARHDAGETIWQIAEAEGLSEEEIQDLMLSAHDTALEDAVSSGQLTQEQADRMETHMDQIWSGDFEDAGFGGQCGGWDASSHWQGEN